MLHAMVKQGRKHTEARAKRNAEIAEARATGLTFQEVADAVGLTKQRVIQICKALGDAAKPPDDYMEVRSRAEEVSQLFREGKKVTEIERLSGMSMRTIYRRLRKTKTKVADKRRRPLWDRLADRTIFASGCWLWKGAHNRRGYAVLCSRVGGTPLAHRLTYEALVKPIEPGLTLDHLCRERGCVNPQHMEETTIEENINRGLKPRRNRPQ